MTDKEIDEMGIDRDWLTPTIEQRLASLCECNNQPIHAHSTISFTATWEDSCDCQTCCMPR